MRGCGLLSRDGTVPWVPCTGQASGVTGGTCRQCHRLQGSTARCREEREEGKDHGASVSDVLRLGIMLTGHSCNIKAAMLGTVKQN